MDTQTTLYSILAGIIAILLALFQYFKKTRSKSKLNMVFAFLRGLTIFSMLLLLINPKFEKVSLSIEKPNLVVAIDNSNSIKYLKQEDKAIELVNRFKGSSELNKKFNIEYYTLGNQLSTVDSISFTEQQTNINGAFNQLSQVYKESIAPTVLISDGNQTYGNDYQFSYSSYKQPIFSVILGDTITYTDLKIKQLNVNRYAYLKNRFPVETILVYKGNSTVTSRFVITKAGKAVYSKNVTFSKKENSKIINFTLPANTIGVNSYRASLVSLNNEKNTVNNSKNFAIEVLDQKTKIAIISDFYHPDIGMLKKSIEANEQRSVSLLNTNSAISQIDDFQLVIAYQPNHKFKKVYEELKRLGKNKFVIIGTKTDLDFINSTSNLYSHEILDQSEDYQAALNLNDSPFIIDDIDFQSFPPLESNYGSVIFNTPFQSVLNKTINGNSINEPLLVTLEANSKREAVLFGEHIWRWRAQSFLNSKSFNAFDNFIGKLIQFLASNKRRSRLNVNYKSFYNGSTDIIINAQFFDKNYVFDARETLRIIVKDKVSKEEKVLPLILKNNGYEVNLSSLPPSEYNFTVRTTNEKIAKSGSFKVLEYNVEQQFLNADVTTLQQLSTNSEAKSYFIGNTKGLINDLINDNRFTLIQKSNKKIIPLIDWKFLLVLIILSLSTEWFLRKYNGLI